MSGFDATIEIRSARPAWAVPIAAAGLLLALIAVLIADTPVWLRVLLAAGLGLGLGVGMAAQSAGRDCAGSRGALAHAFGRLAAGAGYGRDGEGRVASPARFYFAASGGADPARRCCRIEVAAGEIKSAGVAHACDAGRRGMAVIAGTVA